MRAVSCVRTEFPFAFGQEPYPILGTEPLHSLSRPLGRDEPHIRPGNRFADRLRISGIILLPFDVRLHEAGGISRTVWPSALSSRDQWCDEAQAAEKRASSGVSRSQLT